MATDPKTEGKSETKKAQESTETAAKKLVFSSHALLKTPIVMKREKSKDGKRNKRYTRGTKGLQRFLYGLSRAASRSTNSVAKGVKTFAKRSNKSARKRRDGLVRDSLRNASRGFGSGFRELGKAPEEIARRISTRRVWRTFRIVTPFAR